jgi:hypothetical protein
MASSGTLKGRHRSHSECAAAAKGGTAVLWRLIAADLKAAIAIVIVRESGRSGIP